jgi:hypothetical protein
MDRGVAVTAPTVRRRSPLPLYAQAAFDALDLCGGWTSLPAIERRIGWARRQTQRGLSALLAEGLIERSDWVHDGGTQRYLYRIARQVRPCSVEELTLLPYEFRTPARTYRPGPACPRCPTKRGQQCFDMRSVTQANNRSPKSWRRLLRPHPERLIRQGGSTDV